MKALYAYFFLLFLVPAQGLFAQSFSTRVSAKTIGKNDRVQVEYVASNAEVSQFKLPDFPGWVILSGPNMSSNKMIVGNTVTSTVSFGVTLVPKFTGKLVIPGATALLNNKPTQTSAVVVQVKNTDHVPGSQRPQAQPGPSFRPAPVPPQEFGGDQFLQKGENARDKINDNILVVAEASKRTVVVGEPILITYKLCTRLRSQSKVVSQPSFTGATVIEMTTENPLPTREMVNGKMYNVYVIRQVQLVPLQEGILQIPEAAVENKVSFYDAGNVNYRDLYYSIPSLPVEEVTVTTKNKPGQVQVNALPPLPAVGPAEFSGAVGVYDIAVAPFKATIETNSNNQLVVVVMGEGNMQQMKPPVLHWPAGIEGFDPTVQMQEDKTYFPVRTRKAFTYTFVVNKPGPFTLAPVNFTYFDPAAGKYVSKKTQSVSFVAVKGSGGNSFIISDNPDSDFNGRLIIIIGAGLLAVIIGFIWFKDRNRQVAKPAAQSAAATPPESAPEKPQASTSVFIFKIRELCPEENTAVFYKQLYNNLNEFIEARLLIKPHRLQEYIIKKTGDAAPYNQLQQLLSNCTLGMYTPVFSIEEAMQHRLLAVETLSRIENDMV